jgi:hypothetical protein
MPVVYKLTRADGLEYIGITVNFKQRVKDHTKSARFQQGITYTEILFESADYSECEERETYFINYYDTYHSGLNMTPTGKGKNLDCKFNTLGMQMSDQTRQKISAAHKGKISWNRGKQHTEKTKHHWSVVRKGKRHSSKLSKDTVKMIRDEFTKFKDNFTPLGNGRNGRPVTALVEYAKVNHTRFGLTYPGLRNILVNKSWQDV